MMIKAIILDIDGVLVGENKGFNFPEPHADVLARLKAIRASGIPISLCTAKPHYAVKTIIDQAGLNNLHITMAGGVLIDPIDNVILKKHVLNPAQAKAVLKTYIANHTYTEIYSVDNYFIQADQVSALTKQHAEILQQKPVIVNALTDEIDNHEVVKVMPISKDEADMNRLQTLFKPYAQNLILSWGIHPFAAPHKFGNITAQGISKRQATTEFAQSLGILSDEILGVGDSLVDWQFMELCGYAAAMGNADKALKEHVTSKDARSYIGPKVDENGILDIFDHFGL